MMPIGLAATSAAAYGISDYLGGVASRRVPALRVVCVSYPVSILLVGVLALLVDGRPGVTGLAWGAASGVSSGIAVWSFYVALSRGPMSVISPITAVLAAAIPLVAGLAMGEQPGTRALVGTGVAVVATVLVSLEERAAEDGAVGSVPRMTTTVALLTVVSGVTFALFFVLLGQVPAGEGLWPLLASRVGATVVVLVAALTTRQSLAPSRRLVAVGAAIALFDVLANGAFYAASQMALLSLVSVIAALYPAFTVLLALTHGGERVRAVQVTGMLLGAVAIALITLG